MMHVEEGKIGLDEKICEVTTVMFRRTCGGNINVSGNLLSSAHSVGDD
jgi:hypothetical protein